MAETIANPEPAKVISRASECMRRLMEAGLTYDDLQEPINNPEMRQRLVHFWQFGCYGLTVTQKFARATGIPIFGIREAIQHFGVKPTRAQLSALAEIPFTEAELRECKDTHILVAVFPVSILDIRNKVGYKLFTDDANAFCHDKQAFAKNKGEAMWCLVRRVPVPNSLGKTWNEQQAILSANEEMPTAQVMTYTIIGHFLATGERLFENINICCSDVSPVGGRVHVGYFSSRSHGLYFGAHWDHEYPLTVYVAPLRKPTRR